MTTAQQFPDVSAKYGAPMGRANRCGDPEAEVTLFEVNMVDGDYDDGGAYWGGFPSKPLFCARSQDNTVLLFYRAANIELARETVLFHYPDLKVTV